MKKTALLNQPLSAVIAGLGHMDTLAIADAGLPIPQETQRIDLAVSRGIPAFFDVLSAVLSEMAVERAVVAEEMLAVSPDIYDRLRQMLGDIPIDLAPHVGFKETTRSARAVIRTGECTPYANVILVAGVAF